MFNMKQLVVSAAILAGVAMSGQALASKLADQTGNAGDRADEEPPVRRGERLRRSSEQSRQRLVLHVC